MYRVVDDEFATVSVALNGRTETGQATSRTLLSDFLRHTLGATGTHVGCEHGVCGCCTVLIDGVAARSCLTLAVQVDGQSIETVEGLAENQKELNELQKAFSKHHALQCGYCTPGILMSFTDYLRRNPNPDEADVRDVLSGHICRCTGYDAIVTAVLDAAAELRNNLSSPHNMIHPSTVGPSDEDISPDEVAPGIFRLKIPVPFRGLRYVNLWLLRDRDGFTMIDCGWSDDTTHGLLQRHWDAVLGGLPITRLIITHFHPDHAGNCRFICERWGLRPIMPQLEWMAANVAMRSMYSDDFDLKASYFEQNGVSSELLARYRAENMQYAAGAALTDSFERIRAGDRLRIGERDWQILLGLGHSPEMALLYSARRRRPH